MELTVHNNDGEGLRAEEMTKGLPPWRYFHPRSYSLPPSPPFNPPLWVDLIRLISSSLLLVYWLPPKRVCPSQRTDFLPLVCVLIGIIIGKRVGRRWMMRSR